jgi:hypothetical protein
MRLTPKKTTLKNKMLRIFIMYTRETILRLYIMHCKLEGIGRRLEKKTTLRNVISFGDHLTIHQRHLRGSIKESLEATKSLFTIT